MTGIVYAEVPYVPPPSGHVPGWDHLEVEWHGADGSVWDLTNPDSGVFIQRAGFRGLGMPTIIHHRDRTPARPGAHWRGYTVDSREAHWIVHLFHDGGTREFVELDRAFWKAFHPDSEGELVVRVPGVSERRLSLRYIDDGNWAPEQDPTFFGWTKYEMDLQADSNPFWRETVEPVQWSASAPSLFHGGKTAGAPIIRVSSGRLTSSATLVNTGDEESTGTWTVFGPSTFASISIGGKLMEFPMTLSNDSQWIKVDTRPDMLTVVDHTGANRITGMGAFNPIPIPRGEVPIALTMTGTGRIRLERENLFHRAW